LNAPADLILSTDSTIVREIPVTRRAPVTAGTGVTVKSNSAAAGRHILLE
jgi:hypothetical protein